MSRIKLQNPNCEISEVKNVFDEIKEVTGWIVPSTYRAFGLHSHILQAAWNRTKRILSEWNLDRILKEQIAFAVSSINWCKICCHIHKANLIKFWIDEVEVEKNWEWKSTEKKIEFILNFTRTATKNPENITDEDFEKLRNYWYSDEDILEILTVMEMYTWYNKIIISLNLQIEDLTFKK